MSKRCSQATPNNGNLNRKSSQVQSRTHGKVLDHSSIPLSYGQLLSFGAPAHYEENATN